MSPIGATTDSATRGNRCELIAVLLVVVATICRVWLMSLSSGFARDEAGLLWVTADGAQAIWERVVHFPQSLLYSYVILALERGIGSAEWVLRTPSLLASIGTIVIVGRFVSARLGWTAAAYAVLCWLSWNEGVAVGNAVRPYALGVFTFVVSWFTLVRWMESPTKRGAILWALASGLPGLFSVFFLPTVACQGLFLIARTKENCTWRETAREVWFPSATALAVQVPAVYFLYAVRPGAALHSYLPKPTFVAFLDFLLPLRIGLALALLLTFGQIVRGTRSMAGGTLRDAYMTSRTQLRKPIVLTGAVQAVATIVVVCVVSALPNAPSLCAPRYMLGALMSQAVCLGVVIAACGSPLLRVSAMTTVLLVGLAGHWQVSKLLARDGADWRVAKDVDWRSAGHVAVEAAHAEAVTAFGVPVFAEALKLRYPLALWDSECLLYPYSVYGSALRPIPPPEAPDGEEALRVFCEERLAEGGRFVLVRHEIWSMTRLRAVLNSQFEPRLLWQGNGVAVELWQKRTVSADADGAEREGTELRAVSRASVQSPV